MNVFLEKLSESYVNDFILLVADGAAWHKSKGLKIPPNIEIFSLPPYTAENITFTSGELSNLYFFGVTVTYH